MFVLTHKVSVRKYLAIFLAAVLLLGCVPSALAAKKSDGSTSSSLQNLGQYWYYLPSTVPSDYLGESGAVDQTVRIYNSNGQGNQEYSRSVTAEFVSGDEALKDILETGTRTESVWNGDGETTEEEVGYYTLHLENAATPGTADFHITAESDHYMVTYDVTLRILSWEEYPLFEMGEKVPGRILNVGDEKTAQQIFAGTVVSHTAEIAKMLGLDRWPNIIYEAAFFDAETHDYINMDYYFVGAVNEQEEPKTPIVQLESPYGVLGYRFTAPGTYTAEVHRNINNIRCSLSLPVTVLPYRITGATALKPGASATVSVQDEEGSGRSFTLSLEGEGVTLDPDTGTLTAAEDAVPGSVYTVTATPSDGGTPVVLSGLIANGALGGVPIEMMEYVDFMVPVFSDDDGTYRNGSGNGFVYGVSSADDLPQLQVRTNGYNLEEYAEDPEVAARILEDYSFEGLKDVNTQMVEINGRPVLIATATVLADDGSDDSFWGLARMVFDNIDLWLRVWSYPGSTGTIADCPHVTFEDLIALAEKVEYNPPADAVRVADGAITITAKDDAKAVTAGKKLQFTAAFASPDKVNKKAKNDTVEWSVVDAATQQAPENASIDKKGSLSVKPALNQVMNLEVVATSPVFHTKTVYPVTAIPAAKKVFVEPAELFFYVGTDTPQTVKAALEPDTVPLIGITWTPAKADIVEITAAEDGTASVKPLKAGKTTVAVKEPGGKNAKLNVSVVDPVEAVELSFKGKAKAGGTVTVAAALQPKTAGNKNVEWSVDVSEDIATIDAKGSLKIGKEVSSGTKITVTCKALGAPEPLTQTLEITVE